MSKKYRILLVDDHALFRDGMRALLSQESDIEVVGEAGDGQSALRLVNTLQPDLVLLDLTMPGISGVETIRNIRRSHPQTRIIVITVHKSDEYIHESLRAGANGYLLKESTHAELRIAISNVLQGKMYLCPDVSEKVINGYLGLDGGYGPSHSRDILTTREREVLKLIAESNSNRQISEYLGISIKTVEKHRANLMKKLGMRNAAALTTYAIEKGLVAL